MMRFQLSFLAFGCLPAVAMAQNPDWSGAYVGVQIGTGTFDTGNYPDCSQACPAVVADAPFDVSTTGVHAGYLWDTGTIILGVEADHSRFDVQWRDAYSSGATGFEHRNTVTRVKGLIGYDAGRWMPYATAGVGQLSGDSFDGVDLTVIGAGAMVQVTDQVRVGADVLQHRFDTAFDGTFGAISSDTATTVSLKVSFNF